MTDMSRETMGQIMLWLYVFALLIPFGQLLRRAGFNRWWLLLSFLPIINIVALWIFAYIRWPKDNEAR
jgi:hypothetical protein